MSWPRRSLLAALIVLVAIVPMCWLLARSDELSNIALWVGVTVSVHLALMTAIAPYAVAMYRTFAPVARWLWLGSCVYLGCMVVAVVGFAPLRITDAPTRATLAVLLGLDVAVGISMAPLLGRWILSLLRWMKWMMPYFWRVAGGFSKLIPAAKTGATDQSLDVAILHMRRLTTDLSFVNNQKLFGLPFLNHEKLFSRIPKIAGSMLSIMLNMRFGRTMSGASIDEAVAAGRAYLPSLASLLPVFPLPRRWSFTPQDVQTLFATVLLSGAYRTGRLDLLDEAIDLLRQSVSSRRNTDSLNLLGCALLERHHRTDDVQTIDEAVGLLHEASTAENTSREILATYRTDLGRALLSRADATGSVDDLKGAQRAIQEAIDTTSKEDPQYAVRLLCLALVSIQTAFLTQESEAFLRAADLARQAAMQHRSSHHVQFHAANLWGASAVAGGDWNGAITGYRTVIALLPTVAWHGLSTSDRQWLLSDCTDLGSDAAAAAISNNDVPLAVEFLEHSRAVLWNQLLHTRNVPQLTNGPSDLVPRLARIGTQLATLNDLPASRTGRARIIEWWEAAERRLALAREWDALTERIRPLSGRELFLLPRSYEELAADAYGPIVLVNINEVRCDALIINGGPPQLIPLPNVTVSSLELHVNRVYSAYDRAKQGIDWADHISFQRCLDNTLTWLWDTVAEPVLHALGHTAPPGHDQPWPRVWWCPIGQLALLPLHAAGYHTSGHNTVMDRVVSSYTTTLHALQRSRRPAALPDELQLLLVDVPNAPRLQYLACASTETDAIGRRLPNNHDRLSGPQATSTAVLAALRTHPCVHFACHGILAPDSTQSSLHMHDGPLTVADISALHLPDAAFAYLSACETAIPDRRLSDEVIHPAAALQTAGYRHVIATLWNIRSQHAVQIADSVYAHLTTPTNRLTLDHTANALHNAVRHLRDNYTHAPGVWAAYVHYGP